MNQVSTVGLDLAKHIFQRACRKVFWPEGEVVPPLVV
jgi:hypothetical protein